MNSPAASSGSLAKLRVRAPDISVVVQGPLFGAPHEFLTRRALRGLRQHLPGAEIILSTWTGAVTEGLEYDQLVLSDDPGAPVQPHDPRYLFNLNRQIASTLAGLKKASRPYAMKIRTDMILAGTSFLDYFPQFPARESEYSIFDRRVICPTLYSTHPGRSSEIFKVSDFFTFGQTADVLDLWDIPLAPEPATSRYFELQPDRRWHGEPIWNQFTPEQYIWVHCLLKHRSLPFCDAHDYSPEAIQLAERLAVNNFIFLEMNQIPLEAPRHRVPRSAWASCYSHVEWLGLYRQHCAPDYAVPVDWLKPVKLSVQLLLRLREKATGRPGGVQIPATKRV